MQALYSGPPVPWPHRLYTRRFLQSSCDVVFDFDWAAVIGHGQPKFPGLHDLSQAVARFAKVCGKAPLLLLTDKADVPFDELMTDSTYVALVNIKDFLACTKGQDQDRAALFFLSAISKHGIIAAASGGAATPIRVQQLIKALEIGLDGKDSVLLEVMNKGGSKLTLGLLDAAVKALDKTSSARTWRL